MIRPLKILITSLIVIVVVVGLWIGASLYFARELEVPHYTVFSQNKGFEVRDYSPYLIAEVMLNGDFETTLQSGSRILVDYLFGNNIGSTSIARLVPVRELVTGEKGDTHLISFVLPSNYSMETIPRPTNKDIHLHAIPTSRVVALQFGGYPTEIRVYQQKRRLLQMLRAIGVVPLSEVMYVRYSPLFTIPFLMKNEVMVVI